MNYLQAPALPGYIYQTILDLRGEIDNAFWAQQTFRGEYESAQSWTSREILRAGSENSLAILSRALERLNRDTFKLWLHMIYIYSDDADFVNSQIKPILGEEGTERFDCIKGVTWTWESPV